MRIIFSNIIIFSFYFILFYILEIWSKLTTMASLGIVDKHHEQEFLAVMQSYMLWDTGAGADCSQSSGLRVLGLIHAKHGTAITDYLLSQLKEAQNEV